MSHRTLIAAILFAPLVGHANLQLDSAVTCSGELAVQAGIDLPSTVVCSGSLSFAGASLSSDTDLRITAAQDLSFEGVLISAPSLTMEAGGTLTLDARSTLQANDVRLASNTMVISGTTTPLPEPGTWALMLAGLMALAVTRTTVPRPALQVR